MYRERSVKIRMIAGIMNGEHFIGRRLNLWWGGRGKTGKI